MNIKLFTLTLLSTLLFTITYAQEPEFEWAAGQGRNSVGNGNAQGNSIAIDGSGNVYTIGSFSGRVDFDPGIGIFNLISSGSGIYDIFISKLDANGNFIWAKAIGGTGGDYGNSIAIDGSGNIYITGSFEDTVDFDPGPGTFNLFAVGISDIFISKLDANGNFIWAKAMGEYRGDVGHSIALDNSGNVYTTGLFYNTVDFDPDPLTSYYLNTTGGGTFISKLDANGNFIWAKAMPASIGSDVYAKSIAIDGSNNVYTTGYFDGVFKPDPLRPSYNISNIGGNDIFISKLNSNGDLIWAKTMGGTDNETGNSIAIDDSGNVYTTGSFEGTADFDPGPGTFNLSSGWVSFIDIFISKLDSNGNFIWAKDAAKARIGGVGNAITIDGKGNIYTTGYFSFSSYLNPGALEFDFSSAGYTDIFISKLNTNGDLIWAKAMGGRDWDNGYSIAIDGRGAIYTTGDFQDVVDFDPAPSTSFYLNKLSGSAFVLKLSQCTTQVRGNVFLDLNENCTKDTAEINIEHTPLIIIQPGNHTVQTSNKGRWQIDSLPAGNYTATIDTTNANWVLTCPPTQSFTVQNIDNCTLGPDYGFISKYPCADPDISIAMPFMRRGFANQKIYVQACNLNSATDSLSNAYAIVKLDSNISVQNASMSYTDIGNNIYEVQLGDLLPGECVDFHFNTTVEHSAVALQTLCLKAELFPQADCVFDSTETPYIVDTSFTPCTLPWDKSSISVEGWCNQDSVYFNITNTGDIGSGDMLCYSPMRFYIDGILVKFDSVMLQGQETMTLAYAGTGETFSLEVDQHPLHPGHSRPNAHIENCGTGNWTPGIIPQMPTDDIDPIVDVFCGQVTAPLDPNDKRGFPLGVGEQNIIRANQNLEYIIRFQNVGTDTAVNIVVKDTLSEDFNIFTLQSGVSSHTYEFTISGQRELTWRFNNIMLPDSTTDLQNSNGFVMFKVEQMPNLPLGTVLENRAGIYFDFEDPVITNTSTHTISEFNLLPVGIDEISFCDSSEYTWIDSNTYYTDNNTATYTLPGAAASGIDSIVRLNLSFNTSSSGIDTVVACDSLTWIDGNTYYGNNNSATYTLQNEKGCDSLVTLNLSLYSSSNESYTETICDGDIYSVHGFGYEQTGFYEDTLFYQSGCDSIRFTVDLRVDSATELTYSETICEGSIYSVHGFDYNQIGTYHDTLLYQNGCDSIRFTIDLTVDSAIELTYTETICEGSIYSVHGFDYNQIGTYHDTLFYQSGCDSIRFTVDLTVDSASVLTYTEIICEGTVYAVHGFDYDQTGFYEDTLFYQSGCDSLRFTVDLTVDSASILTYTEIICEGNVYAVHGFDYDQTGTYHDTLFSQSGCDSVRFTVNLLVDSASVLTYTEIICEGSIYTVHGINYNRTGVYNDTLFFQSGCDSIRFTVDLTVDSATELTYTETICDGDVYSVHGFDYEQTGVYEDTLFFQSGCDSLRFTVDLLVNLVDSTFETQVTCTTTDTGVFVFNGTNINTCDSIHTLTVLLDSCNSIREESFFDFVSIYPNPAKDVLIVQIKAPLMSGGMSGGIYSLEGKLLQNLTLKEGANTVNVNQHAAGLYFLQLVSKGEQKVFKVVLEP